MNTQDNRTCQTDVLIVGSGAAALNAAVQLRQKTKALTPAPRITLLTEGMNCGTSRNTGSDKQTYYKLSLSGDMPDSPTDLARDLFAGGCVDGDLAYVEAALSTPSFLHLAQLGVPFPTNRLGEYVGYKTDHDPRARATSAGPLTSKLMTESLEAALRATDVTVMDGYLAVDLVTRKEDGRVRVLGVMALDLGADPDCENPFVFVRAAQTVWATGGPAGIYRDSVYPLGHHGTHGVAFAAGAAGVNLTEWQYGLASVDPRWNVSGTYMQVLPSFISVDPDGTEHAFLEDYARQTGTDMQSLVFLKGYQWPFDSRKARDGSSVVDLLVYRECKMYGRRVYLDYRRNPGGLAEFPFSTLSAEAQDYLGAAQALFGTPLDRLRHMNEPAYRLYLSFGRDLSRERLEIALCAQHNNGGLEVDLFWQSNLDGFFVCGEAAGTHGIYRPGGSALNAGQCGSLRIANYLSAHPELLRASPEPCPEADRILSRETERLSAWKKSGASSEPLAALQKAQGIMSENGGPIRNPEKMWKAYDELASMLQNLDRLIRVRTAEDAKDAFLLRSTLISQLMYLSAMQDYLACGGQSRGSALYSNPKGECAAGLDETFRYTEDGDAHKGEIRVTLYNDGQIVNTTRPVRPLPEGGGFFENVWRSYRQTGNCTYEQGERI